jgi:hypothetical protein
MTATLIPRAECDLFCWRCVTLGIPTPTILEGTPYVKAQVGPRVRIACVDCWERLQEECNAMD